MNLNYTLRTRLSGQSLPAVYMWAGQVDHWWLLSCYYYIIVARCISTFVSSLQNISAQESSIFFIHSADSLWQLAVIIVFAHIVRPHFTKSSKTKQIQAKTMVTTWRDCGSGQVDHWWHMSCFFLSLCTKVETFYWKLRCIKRSALRNWQQKQWK